MLAVEIWICFPEILQRLTIPDVPESMGSLIIFFSQKINLYALVVATGVCGRKQTI